MREKQSTGAATFDIHIDANVETKMFARITDLGLLPALANTNPAIRLASGQ
jgi:hypothetical protein